MNEVCRRNATKTPMNETLGARVLFAIAGMTGVMAGCSTAAPSEAIGSGESALGSVVTPDEIAALAKGAGLPCDRLVVATAVALR